MSMREIKPGLWALDVQVWRNGKQFRRREEFRGGRKAADERCHVLRLELREKAGECSLKVATTLKDLIDYYLARVKIDPDSRTYFTRMTEEIGAVQIHELRPKFDQFLLILRQSVSAVTGRPYSNQTINHYLKWANAAVNFGVENGLMDRNPLEGIRRLKTVPRDRYLDQGERLRLLNAVQSECPHLYPIVNFASQVPCRSGELLLLQRDCLDLFNNAIRVKHETAKGDYGSWKPIPEDMAEYFRSIPKECPYLFYRYVKENDEYVPLGDFRKSWKKALKKAKISDFRFHDLRHITATDLLNAGMPEQAVCQVAGWKSGNMIRKYYHKDGMGAVRTFTEYKKRSKPDTDRTLSGKSENASH